MGASLKPNRYSHIAVKRLVEQNVETNAFGLKVGEVSEVQVKTKFNDFQNIHTISLYIGKKHQPEYYDEILKLKPKRVLFNPGTENPDFYKVLKNNGIEVEEACTLVLLSTGQY